MQYMSVKRRSISIEYNDFSISSNSRSKSNSIDSELWSMDSQSHSIDSDEDYIISNKVEEKTEKSHKYRVIKKKSDEKLFSKPVRKRRSRDKTLIIDKNFIHHSPVYSTFLELMKKFNKK